MESQLCQCPYCGEEVEVAVDALGVEHAEYVEDCSVCCRPWRVQITRDGSDVFVSLSRDDE